MSDLACECTHEPDEHMNTWGYCTILNCRCWIFREQFDWDDAMVVEHGLR